MQIRQALVHDLAAIITCADLAFESVSGGPGEQTLTLDGALTSQVGEGVIYLIGDSTRSLGYISLWPISDHLFVDTIAVLPAHQGQGLGRRLLAFAESEASRLGLHSVRLFTKEVMADNLAFYQRRGYRETGRCDEDGYSRVFYRKHVLPRVAVAVS